MVGNAVTKGTDNLAGIVDATGFGIDRTGQVNRGEGTGGVQKAMVGNAVTKGTHNLAGIVDASGEGVVAPGTSIVVKVPPVSRNPWGAPPV